MMLGRAAVNDMPQAICFAKTEADRGVYRLNLRQPFCSIKTIYDTCVYLKQRRKEKMMYVWLIVGFILLVKGADYLVDGSSSLAKIFRVPSVIIGLTIVAFGTSCPEAAVSITASIEGKNAISLGNVVGSNIFNLMVVTGASAVVKPILVDKGILKREFPFSILVAAVLLICSADTMILGAESNTIGRGEGVLLLILFFLFVGVMVWSALKNRTEAGEEYKTMSLAKSLFCIVLGLAAVIVGGQLVVDSATDIARTFGLSETLIGLTIVAMGTSLPELMTSIVAAAKGESDLALGNVVGSNIFNILLILGASSAIVPLSVGTEIIYDTAILIGMSVIVYFMALHQKRIGRVKGLIMLLGYAAYMVYIIMR